MKVLMLALVLTVAMVLAACDDCPGDAGADADETGIPILWDPDLVAPIQPGPTPVIDGFSPVPRPWEHDADQPDAD